MRMPKPRYPYKEKARLKARLQQEHRVAALVETLQAPYPDDIRRDWIKARLLGLAKGREK